MMKKCGKCHIEKMANDFSKSKASRDGLQGYCKSCMKTYNQNHSPQYWRDYYLKNKDKIKTYNQSYYAANKEKRLIWEHENKEKRNAYFREYRQINKKKVAGWRAKRHAFNLKATPLWTDFDKVQAYYDVAAFFNEVNGYVKYHVDHVIPLRGEKVCGLHVHTNLRVILATENLSKNNRFEIQS